MAPVLAKMGVTLFSKSSMEFFYAALKKIKDQHNMDEKVCEVNIHSVMSIRNPTACNMLQRYINRSGVKLVLLPFLVEASGLPAAHDPKPDI